MTARLVIRWTAFLLLTVVFVLGGLAYWWHQALWTPTQTPEKTLDIQPGAGATSILHQLADAEILPSVPAGRLYLEGPARGREMQWGTYVIPASSRPVDVLEMLLQGRVKQFSLTVIEGMSSEDIKHVLDAAGVDGTEVWPSVINDPELISDLAPGAPSLEGFLFPDTYTYSTGITPATIARIMTNRFRTVWAEEQATAIRPSMTTSDVVTLASLVEAETSVPEERRRVAGVFVNRLRRGMLLQCDPTVVYALKRRGEWSGRLLRVHWKIDDPYNTYRFPGLPPGPINNPGRAALKAAMDPESHNLLYFVADDSGGHT
ncbi:MAG: endolytic transglycosylase MltG, partial [Acidobacteriota bacterium]